MEKWKKTSYTAAVFMFLIGLHPLEPYLTAYQTGPNGNVSLSEVANTRALIKTYSALCISLVTSISADHLLYKPNIIFLTSWACISYGLMASSSGVMQQRVATVGIETLLSTALLVYSYLYAQIEDIHQFQMATAIVSVAQNLGKVVGDLLAEYIVNATGGDYTVLPYCDVTIMFLAVIWACLFFPSIERKCSFHIAGVPNEKSRLLKHAKESTTEFCGKKYDKNILFKVYNKVTFISREMWINFKTSYSNSTVLKIIIWHIVGGAAVIEVLVNINLLYSYVVEKPGNHDTLSNGYAEAMSTLCGVAGAYAIGKVRLDWTRHGDMFTAFCSIVMGVLIMSCYFYDHLIAIYSSYMLYCVIFQAHYVIIMSEIAKQLKTQCYSLVYQLNYLASSILNIILMSFFTQFNFLNITIPGRFLFIGGLFVVLGIYFLSSNFFKDEKRKSSTNPKSVI